LAEEPNNGYQIATNIGISKGAVYDHLHDLQEAGMVRIKEKQEGGREAKKYEITENGMLLLKALDEL
jgi:DNA-binding PadR family transcriptional regulator